MCLIDDLFGKISPLTLSLSASLSIFSKLQKYENIEYMMFCDWYQRRVRKFWALIRNSRKNSDLLNSTWIKYLAFDTTEECLDWSNLLDKLIVQRKSQIQIRRSVSVTLHGGSGLPVKVILFNIINSNTMRNTPRARTYISWIKDQRVERKIYSNCSLETQLTLHLTHLFARDRHPFVERSSLWFSEIYFNENLPKNSIRRYLHEIISFIFLTESSQQYFWCHSNYDNII